IVEIFNKKYNAFLEDEHFLLESSYLKNKYQIRFTLLKKDNSIAYPIECLFIKDDELKMSHFDIGVCLIDYFSIYWSDYFAEERTVYLTIDWSTHNFEGLTFYLRGFIRNLSLESQADSLLNIHGSGEYHIASISPET
ncbi:MAG: hypothetical protein K2X39_09140, partial [Silvanigrellaceae bacterium]|nr:hypothetical protein [Silvanigrellaceae bacterium]